MVSCPVELPAQQTAIDDVALKDPRVPAQDTGGDCQYTASLHQSAFTHSQGSAISNTNIEIVGYR